MIRTTLLTLAAVALAATGLAQNLPSAPHLTLAQRGAFLLADPSLRGKIGISPAVTAKIAGNLSAYASKQDQLFAAKKPDEAAIQALDASTATGLLSVLPGPQRKQLFRVTLDRAGASALLAPDVRKTLKLTPNQVARIEKAIAKAGLPELRLEEAIATRSESAKDDAERQAIQGEYVGERKRLVQLRKKEEAKAFTVLTPPQKTAFAALRG